MATLRIDDDTFKTEREVVKEERRMRVENQPYGRLSEIIYDQAFTTHPYKHPTIGSMAISRRRRSPTCASSTRRYYVPDERDARAGRRLRYGQRRSHWSTQYLGRVPTAARRCRATSRRNRAQQRERRVTVTEDGRCRPSSSRTTSPTTDIPDSYPLHIASKVLSDGQSSRIYQTLVYEKQLALAAFGGGNIIEDPNLFYAVAIVQPEHTPAKSAKALIAELDRLKQEPISRPRAAAGEEPVRARLHHRPRDRTSRRRRIWRMPP